MNVSSPKQTAGFTLVELIVGMTLSLMVMGAILSTYVYLGKNFIRSLGLSSGNQATLESQGRKTLAYFEQDMRMATLVTDWPVAPDTLANTVKFTTPANTSGVASTIVYYYNSSASSFYLHVGDDIDSVYANSSDVELPANTLSRVVMSTPRVSEVLHHNLLSCAFSYYDTSGKPYTTFSPASPAFSSLSGIKQVAVGLSCQGGDSTIGTQTPVYAVTSPRMILRNKQLLP